MHKKFFILSIIINLISFNNGSAEQNLYHTTAKQALLVEASNGQILFEKDSKVQMAPSSMTKIMTAYIIFDALSKNIIKLDDEYYISKNAFKVEGSTAFLNYNQKVKLEDLLKGIIVSSGNDACVAVAEGMFGKEEVFVKKMNQVAKTLGLNNTYFCNSSGLPAENHLSTCYDLAKLTKNLIDNFPQYYSYHTIKNFKFNNVAQPNRNLLIGKGGVDGVKTGHTNIGGYGMVASAKLNDIRLIAIMNGLKSEKERMTEIARILNYGFNNFIKHVVYNIDEEIIKTNVINGEKNQLSLIVAKPLEILIDKLDHNKEIDIFIEYEDKIKAPIKKGQKIGILKINNLEYLNNATIELIAKEEIKEGNILQKAIQNLNFLLKKYS